MCQALLCYFPESWTLVYKAFMMDFVKSCWRHRGADSDQKQSCLSESLLTVLLLLVFTGKGVCIWPGLPRQGHTGRRLQLLCQTYCQRWVTRMSCHFSAIVKKSQDFALLNPSWCPCWFCQFRPQQPLMHEAVIASSRQQESWDDLFPYTKAHDLESLLFYCDVFFIYFFIQIRD